MGFFFRKKSPFRPELWRFDDIDALSQAGAAFIRELAKISLRRESRFSLALSGGSTPGKLYLQLSGGTMQNAMDWERTDLFWGDERCVPPDAVDSNYNMVRNTLFHRARIPEENVFRIKGELGAEAAAAEYRGVLERYFNSTPAAGPPRFSCILLGVGSDGHTASLFPGTPALEETEQWVAPVLGPKADPPVDRVTLTFPVLNRADTVIVLAGGRSKAEIVRNLLKDPESAQLFPAARVKPASRLVLMADEDALSLI